MRPLQTPYRTWPGKAFGVKPQAFWLLGPDPPNHGCLGLNRKASLNPLSSIPNLPRLLSLGLPVAQGQGEMNHQYPYPHPWSMQSTLFQYLLYMLCMHIPAHTSMWLLC